MASDHPPIDWLRLALAPDIGPVLAHRLLEAWSGDPGGIFGSDRRELAAVAGLGPARLERLLDPALARIAREEARRCEAAGVGLVTLADPGYPTLLRGLEYPPPVLWVRGELRPEDRMAVTIVGPRRPSGYARLMSDRIVPPLAAHGLTLVSGLAHGIDGMVHRAAVEAGGRTLAVVGQGLGSPIYPAANTQLADAIAGGRGALISIFPMQTEPSRGLFAQRNEVLAALGLGTLVVEASPESGTLITARHAAAADRIVMACPGDSTRRAALGSNRLLAEGAVLVQTHLDVLEAMGDELRRAMADLGMPGSRPAAVQGDLFDQPEPAPAPPEPADSLTAGLLELIGREPQPIDSLLELGADLDRPAGQVIERLLALELEGRLRQLPGRIYSLT